MAGGFMGKLLFINLKYRTWRIESPNEKYYRTWLGGYGMAAQIYYERMKPGIDPLGPDNILGFAAGFLTGTRAHGAGRFQVIAKSPATGGWGESNCGGKFGPYLKASGFDMIFLEDISEMPVYVTVYDGDVRFHDASHVWGLNASDTETNLREELGKGYQIATIGPAGENLSAMAGIFTDQGRAAGRMGMGGVMGSKRLKALACGGTFKVPIAHPDQLDAVCKRMVADAKEYWQTSLADYGTSGVYQMFIGLNDTSVKNWKSTAPENNYTLDDAMKLSGEAYIPFRKKKYACSQCAAACGAVLDVKDRDGKKFETHRPEYETIGAFGSNCMNKDLTSVFEANEDCNRYGMDTISAGSTISWAMECNEHGLFTEEELDGLDLSWGNGAVFRELLRRMAYREGFLGDLLCDGMKRASERLGRGSEAFRTDAGGIELPMHDPRKWPGFSLSYSTDAGPGRHNQGALGYIEHAFGCWELYDKFPFLKSVAERMYDFDDDTKGESQKYLSSWIHYLNCLGCCILAVLGNYLHYPLIDTTRAITGWDDFDVDEALLIGERIQDIRHIFNLREGLRPNVEFRLKDRVVGIPPLTSGSTAGISPPVDKYFDMYFKAMDIDPVTCMPSENKLESLGLKDLVMKYWAQAPHID